MATSVRLVRRTVVQPGPHAPTIGFAATESTQEKTMRERLPAAVADAPLPGTESNKYALVAAITWFMPTHLIPNATMAAQ